MTDPEIYILRHGKRIGPYTLGAVRAMLANKSIAPEELAWHEGLNDWMPVAALPLLGGEKRPDRKSLTVIKTKSNTSPIPNMVSTRVARISEQNKMITGMHEYHRPRSGTFGIICAILGTALVISAFLYARAQWIEKSLPRKYQQALESAQSEKKLLLLHFTRPDTNAQSKKLIEDVFSQEDFQKWAAQNIVILEINLDRPLYGEKDLKAIVKRFNVDHLPMIIIVNGEDDMLGRFKYREGGPAAWIPEFESFKQ